MKAFLLAAGKGERMRPLTDRLPKPLLEVLDGRTLLDYQLEKLFSAGIEQVIINTAYLGQKIRSYVRSHYAYRGKEILFSEEPHPLETGGALNFAMDLLGNDPFILVNGDVWIDMDYGALLAKVPALTAVNEGGGHLVLVDNPQHNAKGDFLLKNKLLHPMPQHLDDTNNSPPQGNTYSGISILSPDVIRQYPKRREVFPLREVFLWAMHIGRMSGESYDGFWLDVGTPERLAYLRTYLTP